MEKILITVKDFLRQYTISRTSFYAEVKNGNLPIIKRGRRTLVAKEDADAWVKKLRQNSHGGAV